MALNGISTLSTKEAKQVAKLNLASLKRQGYTLNPDGTIASGPDPSKNFFRSRDSYDITELPTQYSGNAIVDNPNSGGLVLGRPWVTAISAPTAITTESGTFITTEGGVPLVA